MRGVVSCAVAAAMLVCGCSSGAAPESVDLGRPKPIRSELNFERFFEVLPAAQPLGRLGEGFDVAAGRPTGNTCVRKKGRFRDRQPSSFVWSVSTVRHVAGLRPRLMVELEHHAPDAWFGPGFEALLRERWFDERGEAFLGLVVTRLKTTIYGTLQSNKPNRVADGLLCDDEEPESRFSSLDEMLTSCGDSLIRSREFGGVVLMIADLSVLSASAAAQFQAGRFKDLVGTPIEVEVYTAGVLEPPPAMRTESGHIRVDQIGDYLVHSQASSTEAYSEGRFDDPAAGLALGYTRGNYTSLRSRGCEREPGDLAEFGGDAFTCYRHFLTVSDRRRRDEIWRKLEGAADWTLFGLNNPEAVKNGDQGVAARRALLEDTRACMASIEAAREACIGARRAGDSDRFCELCQFEAGCTPDEMFKRYVRIPDDHHAPLRNDLR